MTVKTLGTHFLSFLLLFGIAAGCNGTSPSSSTSTSMNSTTGSETPSAATSNADHDAALPSDRTNTGVNVRDRDDSAKTPIDQNENQTDINITADIRSRVVDTKMSIDAQNVKIITQNGKVTLRGPVKTDEEKRKIEEIATAVAGAGNVDNQLEVNK